MYAKKIKFLAFTFLENALNLCIFTYGPVHHLNFQAEFFENLLPPSKNDLLYQIQSENMKMIWNIRLFVFCMIYNFSRCDGFTVL